MGRNSFNDRRGQHKSAPRDLMCAINVWRGSGDTKEKLQVRVWYNELLAMGEDIQEVE